MGVKVTTLDKLSTSDRERVEWLADEYYGSRKWLQEPSNPQEIAYFKENGEIQGFQLFTTDVTNLEKHQYQYVSNKVSTPVTILHHLIVAKPFQGEGKAKKLINKVESLNSQLNLAKGWVPSGSGFLESVDYFAITDKKKLWNTINFTCNRCGNSPCSCEGIIYSSQNI